MKKINIMNIKLKVSIIGLGYIGLPLSLEFAKYRNVIAYDINKKRINELNKGIDNTKEITKKEILNINKIKFTNNFSDLRYSNCFIICVPTPVNKNHKPDIRNLKNITSKISKLISKNSIIIYESTFYPGLTEEICVPIIEKYSNLKYNKDFYCGYCPERINPGDKFRKINNIKKLVSASNKKSLELIYNLYNQINPNNIIKVKSIKIAESAKVIENCQRDINIAFINELSIIFNKLNINIHDVLKAASTKWNFVPYYPGLVGGHCIGVDPYYLAYKSKSIGYNPKIVLSGRSINNYMPKYVIKNLLTGMKNKNISINNARLLILGLTFKENCPDTRNSKIFEIISTLSKKNINIHVYDPWVKKNIVEEKGFKLIKKLTNFRYDAVLYAVAHNQFKKISFNFLKKICKKQFFLYDLKNHFDVKSVDMKL